MRPTVCASAWSRTVGLAVPLAPLAPSPSPVPVLVAARAASAGTVGQRTSKGWGWVQSR